MCVSRPISIYTEPIYAHVPLWGRPIVYDSLNRALKPLAEDERKGHYFRLVEVANIRRSMQVLEPERELCHAKAALYVRLNRTCPVHWLAWKDEEGADMEIVSRIPPSASRVDMLSKGTWTPVKYTIPRS